MLNAFWYLLCSKLCQHNPPRPIQQPGTSSPPSRLKRSSTGVIWMCKASFTNNSQLYQNMRGSTTTRSTGGDHRTGRIFFFGLSRSNLPPEVNCPPGASYFEVNRPPLKLFAPPPNPLPPSEGSRAKET